MAAMDIKVTGYSGVKPAASVRKRDGSSSVARFSDFLNAAQTDAMAPASEAMDTAPAAALSQLLALQEISEEERKRERVVRHGKQMLDVLERLRAQLLMGEIPAHLLPELAQSMAQQKETLSDPQLMGIIEDIELRVAVELAKLEMAFSRN